MNTKLALLMFVFFITATFGCSNLTSSVITTEPELPVNFSPIGITDYFPDGSPAAGMAAMGLFQILIDPNKMAADIASLRNSSSQDVLEVVDITNFLKLAPCTDCVKIKSISLDNNGNLVLSIGIKHPFGVGDPLKPITGRNRADLHVFNVEGIVISNAPAIFFPSIGNKIANFNLVNADGYTGYLDSSIDEIYPTEANIHPYILHFDDYSTGNFSPSNPMGFESVTIPPPTGNLVMAMGCDYDYQDYVFDLDMEPVDFIFAVGCTYAVSADTKNKRFTPEYRIPQHNKKAASEVRVLIISNDLKAGDTSSSAKIEIHVVDINHGIPVGNALNEMRADSSVNNIHIDIPFITTSSVVIDGSTPISGSGHDPSDPLIYSATILNSGGAPEGEYIGLVKVADNYSCGLNESPLLNSMDGIKRVDPIANPLTGLFPITQFATYQKFKISVGSGNEPPVAILRSNPSPAVIPQAGTVNFDATSSYDSDGSIVLYEFDFIWDGNQANFSPDLSNTTGLAASLPYVSQGTFLAGLRVTDNLGAVAYDSVTVIVTELQVIYVDDSNTSGIEYGTQQYPYNTIQEGLAAASAGFEVWVDDSGVDYTGPVTLKSNVILKSVNWNTNDGGNMATINYTGSGTAVVNGANNGTIDGFKITGGGMISAIGRTGIIIQNCNSTIRNCWVSNISANATLYGIVVQNSSGSLIENCEVSNIGSTASYNSVWGISLTNSPITIQKCIIHDISAYDNYHFVGGIIVNSCNPSAGNHLILKQNKIYAISSSGLYGGSYINAFGILVKASNDVDITNNLIYNISCGNYDYSDPPSGTHGIALVDSSATDLINNTIHEIYKNYYYGSIFGVRLINCTGFNGRNNIVNYIYKTSSGYFQTAYGVSAPAGTTWEYCDVFNCSNGLYTGGIAPGVGCISANPLFVNPGVDFHLASGSPCINAGDPNIYDPDNSRSDMGCYGGPNGNW